MVKIVALTTYSRRTDNAERWAINMFLFVFLLGLVVFAVAFLVLWNKTAVWTFVLLLGVVIMMTAIVKQSDIREIEKFTSEVDSTQVPIAGQKIFLAQIKIIYKDGKAHSVVIIPKTTVAE